jgi:hypothetical protein
MLFDFHFVEHVFEKLREAIALIARQFQIRFVHGVLPTSCAFKSQETRERFARQKGRGTRIGTTLGRNGI